MKKIDKRLDAIEKKAIQFAKESAGKLLKKARKLEDREAEKLFGNIHDFKKYIKSQYGDDLKDSGFGTNFDLYIDDAGQLVLTSNKNKNLRFATNLPVSEF